MKNGAPVGIFDPVRHERFHVGQGQISRLGSKKFPSLTIIDIDVEGDQSSRVNIDIVY